MVEGFDRPCIFDFDLSNYIFFWNEFADSYSERILPPIRGYDILIFTILFSLFGVRPSMIHSAWLLGQNDSDSIVKKRKYE
ncbi:hypothetical protein [Leptospira stimsonii]|uniref:Uncharacterized protein n=1 Tax=Leptospira stimsonii TaxID=2202203 RepID=A0A396YT66_9LEPT|nr:hypothetical protein [Leptospira stimsonii]RHX85133.1 hypothetical protein DLM75_21915 [Leptospira stimsonii]